ncbi:MAG: metallophosphoesterase [Bacteroidota bacterium]
MEKLTTLLIFILLCVQGSAIQQIRWGSTSDPLNGLTITWRNTGTHDSIQWGYTSSMTNGTFAGVRRNGYTNYFFNYTFPSVTPNSTIYYQLFDSGSGSWDSQLTYITAPPVESTNFSFLALGDSRTNMGTWNQISTLCNSKHADFTIFTGDLVASGASNSNWDNWFNNATQYLRNNLSYYCIGNHDASDTVKFENNFTLPMVSNTKLHYFFSYGNAVFICMNTENISTSEYNWMVNVLQENQSKTWKVVFFHRPFFTTGRHAGEMNAYLSTWWAAFDTYGVDLVLNGHDHMYERSKPINYTVSPNAPVPEYGSGSGQGRCEIVCGSAGAPLYTGSPSAWFIQKYQSVYHICKIDVTDCILTDSTFSVSGGLIETFSLNKCIIGIDTNDQKPNKLLCAPNPTEGNFTLHYSSLLTGEAIITIFNMTGNKVAQGKARKTMYDMEYTFNLSNNARGIYLVQVELGNTKVTDRLELK